jgi:hypothetical protein
MLMRSRVGRSVMAMVLCACVATLMTSSTALAQTRGNSGLPAGSGNPMADLQTQITALQQQINAQAALGRDVSILKQQMSTLRAQLDSQTTTLLTLQSDLKTLNSQMDAMASTYGGSGGLAIYDNKHEKVGDVVGVQDSVPWVTLTIDEDHTVVLQMFPDQLIGANLFFDATNCTGNAYINNNPTFNKLPGASGVSAFSLGAVVEPGGVIYAAERGASPFTAFTGTVLSMRDGATGFCSNKNLGTPRVVRAKPVFTLDTMFQRPYRVR